LSRGVEVADGIAWFSARTPTLPPATHTNSYALGDGQVVLVEPATPFDDERAAWLEWAKAVGSSRHIEAIVVTHHHPDHVGGAEHFAGALGVPVWAHSETAARLSVPVARELVDGDELHLGSQRWRVLHTPGHAPGHLCFLEVERRIAVVGDMVASVGTILIDPIEGHLGRYLEELRRLDDLHLALALPAHGDPIQAPSQLFRHYIAHRLAREQKVYAALDARNPCTLDALVARAYADTPEALWPIAQLSLESHLLELERAGRAAHEGTRWRALP
jgi:ribonuclease/clavin/mitogillin